MKRIGVVVPVYNTAEFLRQCVDSILAQSYEKISVVLVDDGSTDGSSEICDEYEKIDNRVKVVHQPNQGKLATRYNGAQILDCDYLTFVDSDDWIAPDTYGRFASNMDNGTDVISWRIIRYFDAEKQRKSKHNYESGYYDEHRFRAEIFPSMIWSLEKNSFGLDPSLCNKLIKKELLIDSLKKAQGLNVGYGDDVAVIYPLLLHVKTLFLSDDCLYYHRQRNTNETADYLLDCEFHKKLLSLYTYLRLYFVNDLSFIDQLDLFYASSIFLPRRKRRFVVEDILKYIFPFDVIPYGKNIVIYGASIVGQSYYKQLSSLQYANSILWVDRNYQNYEQLGVRGIEAIKEAAGYDYAVVAIADETVASRAKEYLSTSLPDKGTEIIWNIREL